MPIDFLPLMLMGFGLGLLHALDADHVMAVSVLSNQQPGLKRTLFFSANWALGHSLMLMLSGLLLFGLGFAIPESLQHLAELSVGVLLIVLGLLCFRQFRQEHISLHTHRHGDIVHTHWHTHDHLSKRSSESSVEAHKPVMVGLLHGLAGSAPALALIPVVSHGQLSTALSYLLLFSVGVMLSMVFFGLGFGYLQTFLAQRYMKLFRISRYMLATASIIIGGYWLVS